MNIKMREVFLDSQIQDFVDWTGSLKSLHAHILIIRNFVLLKFNWSEAPSLFYNTDICFDFLVHWVSVILCICLLKQDFYYVIFHGKI